jgi:hypothetical protein
METKRFSVLRGIGKCLIPFDDALGSFATARAERDFP